MRFKLRAVRFKKLKLKSNIFTVLLPTLSSTEKLYDFDSYVILVQFVNQCINRPYGDFRNVFAVAAPSRACRNIGHHLILNVCGH